ncbi:translation initiation factor eIF-3, subunit D [Meira miltonrushii]|uniref:Eukaryotic translation initiation factor 3 subunit D n=1 Tax=Meira miltonrushii TaxID=1280837 RepID=A0A316VM15_9BASI|nr:translation initiation factor eIF-3, subunit D [Meira miltonrushii]PWN38360.1 translation initiation factor eIF-3, subunit D [Meira miltonrushii]
MASFSLPSLQETPDMWGPPSMASSSGKSTESVLPKEFREIPFTPFAKSDKIGRFADWNNVSSSANQAEGARGAAAQAGGRRADGSQTLGAGASTFTYFHGSDEASFSIVDNTRASGAKRGGAALSQMTRGRGGAARTAGGRQGALGGAVAGRTGAAAGRGGRLGGAQRGGAMGAVGGARGGRRPGWRDWDRPQRTRDPSVVVGPDWEQIEEIEFSRLAKLRLDVGEGEDISQFGSLFEYDRSYDRITSVRFEKPLQPMDRVRYNPTTSEDPILQELASKPVEKLHETSTKPPTRILVTDSILAMLMCSTRSVYPWDIVITRDGNGNIFMDKRDGGAFDYVTVNENAADPPAEIETKEGESVRDKSQLINTPGSLSLEATYINQNFAFQVVNEKKAHKLPNGPNPFYDESTEKEQLASCGYRYRKFDLSTPNHDVELIVRTELDAILKSTTKGQPDQYITIKTLNEFDSRAQGAGGAPDWRTKLDSQRGAVVATEMKNNGAKLARFAVQSLLAKADNMKMGYVSRVSPRDSSRHVVLGTQWYKPRDFAAQINVNFSNGWGIVRTVADLVSKLKDGEEANSPAKFVLAKDPNKTVIRLYRVPLTWPADEDEEDGVLVDGASVPAEA